MEIGLRTLLERFLGFALTKLKIAVLTPMPSAVGLHLTGFPQISTGEADRLSGGYRNTNI